MPILPNKDFTGIQFAGGSTGYFRDPDAQPGVGIGKRLAQYGLTAIRRGLMLLGGATLFFALVEAIR